MSCATGFKRDDCQLGWLIDPEDRSILVFLPDRQPELLQGGDRLSVLAEINRGIRYRYGAARARRRTADLELTVARVFGLLKMREQ